MEGRDFCIALESESEIDIRNRVRLTTVIEARNFKASFEAISRHPSTAIQITWSLLLASRSEEHRDKHPQSGTAGFERRSRT